MVDRAMMTLIALVNRAMEKKLEERESEGEEDEDEQGKEDAKLRVDRQMGNEIIRLLSSLFSLSLSVVD